MSGAELKPCPFCGAEAQMLGGPMAQDAYSVWCKAKGRRHHVNGTMDANQTAAIWNTRADLPPTIAAALALPEIAALIEAAAVARSRIIGIGYALHHTGAINDGQLKMFAEISDAISSALAALDAAKTQ